MRVPRMTGRGALPGQSAQAWLERSSLWRVPVHAAAASGPCRAIVPSCTTAGPSQVAGSSHLTGAPWRGGRPGSGRSRAALPVI